MSTIIKAGRPKGSKNRKPPRDSKTIRVPMALVDSVERMIKEYRDLQKKLDSHY